MNAARLLFLGVLVLAGGCRKSQQPNPAPPAVKTPPVRVQFTDITRPAGIDFIHNNGASGLMLMAETNGSGVAFLDYDGDGLQDLYFANGREWTPAEIAAAQKNYPPSSAARSMKIAQRQPKFNTGVLYRNLGNGKFADATHGSGLEVETYGLGAAVGDYDNDGRPDLYLTAYPRNFLFHNEGGKFREVAAASGVQDSGWSMSAAWLDYDKDGLLDLFVSHYIQWTPGKDVYQKSGRLKGYSNPVAYDGSESRLFKNLGGGKFADVSQAAGITRRKSPDGEVERLLGKGMGVVVCDFNNDGWPDVVQSNDTSRNFLFKNNGDGTFQETAKQVGIAFDQFGRPRAGMGIDTADINHSNRDSAVIGNFSGEMLGLYVNTGSGSFVDAAPNSAVGRASKDFLTFGAMFFDFDNDGWQDLIAANGHVQPNIQVNTPEYSYQQRTLLFRNNGQADFTEIGLQSGAGMAKKIVGRGLASADIDVDGDLDVVLTSNGRAPVLLRNDGGNANHALRLTLRGNKSNRDGIGALVKVKAGGEVQRLWVRSGGSFLSQNELPLTIGLGQSKSAEGIAILWSSGAKTSLENVAGGQMVTVDEESGKVTEQKPFNQP